MYVLICWNDEDRDDLFFLENSNGIRKFETKDKAIEVAKKLNPLYYLVLKMEE